MAGPSYTYTFTNNTTADANQVTQNFTDIIDGLTDGTKDLTISNLVTNGNTTLGSATGDSITLTGSLATGIPIQSGGSYVYTLTPPTSAGIGDGSILVQSGSGTLSFAAANNIGGAYNYGIAAAVAANALTISLKGANGSDPSSTNRVTFEFRNSTITTGTPSFVSATAATSVVISSGSTLGHGSAQPEVIYVYALNASGTIELAVSTSRIFDESGVVTSTAEGGAGAADDRNTLYSTTARSNVAAKLIGVIKSTQTTAGTWAAAPTAISTSVPMWKYFPNSEIYVSGDNGYGSTNTKIPRFSTIEVNRGTGLTYADSASLGASITVNRDMYIAVTYCDLFTSGNNIGVSVNQSGTSSVNTLSIGSLIAFCRVTTANEENSCSGIRRVAPGDVIRPHTNGGTHGPGFIFFRAVEIPI